MRLMRISRVLAGSGATMLLDPFIEVERVAVRHTRDHVGEKLQFPIPNGEWLVACALEVPTITIANERVHERRLGRLAARPGLREFLPSTNCLPHSVHQP